MIELTGSWLGGVLAYVRRLPNPLRLTLNDKSIGWYQTAYYVYASQTLIITPSQQLITTAALDKTGF